MAVKINLSSHFPSSSNSYLEALPIPRMYVSLIEILYVVGYNKKLNT